MRFRVVAGYLAVYYVVIAVAALTAWRSRLLEHVNAGWVAAVLVGAVALGVMLAVLSRE